MIPRYIGVLFIILLVFFALNGESLSYFDEKNENSLPLRWEFSTSLNYQFKLEGWPYLKEFVITISLHRVHGNSPLSLIHNRESVCDVQVTFDSPPFVLTRAELASTEDGSLTLAVSRPISLQTYRLGIICRDIAIDRPSTELERDTPSEYTFTVTENNNVVMQTNELVTIIDALDVTHDFYWGGVHQERHTEAIHVTFTFYFPSRVLEHQQFSIQHPLLNLNKITSMHSQPNGNPGAEYERLYNFIPLAIDHHPPAIVLECNVPGAKVADKSHMSPISFVKDKSTGEIRSIIHLSDQIPTDQPYICSFTFPYPPNVIQHILVTATAKKPHHVKITPVHGNSSMGMEIPIHLPSIIPESRREIPTGIRLWTLPHYAHDNIAEFEISIAVVDRYRDVDGHLSVIPTPPETLTFIFSPLGTEETHFFQLEGWSPVIACKQHWQINYPEDTPLRGGMIDLRPTESSGFSGFGQLCRIRMQSRATDMLGIWAVLSVVFVNGYMADNQPLVTPFNSMHAVQEDLQHFVLPDRGHGKTGEMTEIQENRGIKEMKENGETEEIQNTGSLHVSPSSSSSLQRSTDFDFENSSIPSTIAAEEILKPVPFTKSIDPETQKAYAVGEFHVEFNLPYSLDLVASPVLLRLVFPEYTMADLKSKVIPDRGESIDAILTIQHGDYIVAENIPLEVTAIASDFSPVLGTHHAVEPHEPILHPGCPLRSPHYMLSPPEMSIVLEPRVKYQFTIKFTVNRKTNVKHLAIYPVFVSFMDTYSMSNPHPYAIITPLYPPSTGEGRSRAPIVIGVIAAVAIVMAAGILLYCKFTARGLFRKHTTIADEELSSPLSRVSTSLQGVQNSDGY